MKTGKKWPTLLVNILRECADLTILNFEILCLSAGNGMEGYTIIDRGFSEIKSLGIFIICEILITGILMLWGGRIYKPLHIFDFIIAFVTVSWQGKSAYELIHDVIGNAYPGALPRFFSCVLFTILTLILLLARSYLWEIQEKMHPKIGKPT